MRRKHGLDYYALINQSAQHDRPSAEEDIRTYKLTAGTCLSRNSQIVASNLKDA